MLSLTDSSSNHGADGAGSVVSYFLSNAGTFRGGNAKSLKLELKEHFGIK